MSSSGKNPPRLPQSVYWRRRLLSLAAAVLVLVLLVMAVRWVIGFSQAVWESRQQAKARPNVKVEENAPVACTPKLMEALIETAKSRTGRASSVPIKVKLQAKVDSSPCYVDVGAKNAGILVTGGSVTYLDTRTCPAAEAAAKSKRILLARDSKYQLSFTWDGLRHDHSCDKGPDALGGNYSIDFLVGGSSVADPQTVTVVAPGSNGADRADAGGNEDAKTGKPQRPVAPKETAKNDRH